MPLLFEQHLLSTMNELDTKPLLEAINNPNSSGQGHDPDHAKHSLHSTCVSHGFSYSHSTPIKMLSGSTKSFHSWKHKSGHSVGAYAGSNNWVSKASSASGHSYQGIGADELDRHLSNKRARYNLGESENGDDELLAALVMEFAGGCVADDGDTELNDLFNSFADYHELSQADCQLFISTLQEAADDEKTDIPSLLQVLAKPFPKPEERTPSEIGTLAGERGTRSFLRQLKIAARHDPYSNKGFSADNYKSFDRENNRMGYNYSYDTDINRRTPSRPLANFTQNVEVGTAAFESVNAGVGTGAINQWRVANRFDNTYISPKMLRHEADQLAAQLNQEFVRHLREAAGIRPVVDTPINTLPSTPITEGLLEPLSKAKVDAVNAALGNRKWVMGGSISQTGYGDQTANALRKTQALISQRRKNFGEDENKPDEMSALNQISRRNLRINDTTQPTMLTDRASDARFLQEINNASQASFDNSKPIKENK